MVILMPLRQPYTLKDTDCDKIPKVPITVTRNLVDKF